jgi:hypothetical protein
MLETDDGGAVTAQVIVYQEAADEGAGRMEGKFLQLTLRGQAYLLFAPTTVHRYHNQLLARFLGERRIPHRWATPETLVIGSDEVVVHGGGRFRVDPAARLLTLWDNSQAYGRFDARRIAAQLADSGHAWGGFEIRIE